MGGIAIVTGGSRGIGAATARLLARDGWDVCLSFLGSQEAAQAVVRDVEAAGQRAVAVQCDTAIEADVERLFEACERELGRPTALVNNAGMVGPRGKFEALGVEDMRRVLEVNVIGCMLCARAAIRRMARSHGGEGGAIVNVSSGVAIQGGAHENVLYAVSKGGVNSLTNGLSQELAPDGIRVNTVSPGITDTDMPGPDKVARVGASVPLGRAARPEEIAEGIVWLLSDKASYVAGALLRIGGGRP